MRPRHLTLFVVTLIALAGCARVNVTTTMAADGGFTRVVKYTINSKEGAPGAMPGMPTKAEDAFVIPAASPGVAVAPTSDKDGTSVTVTRKIAPGSAPVQDITALNGKKKPMLTSSIAVRKRSDGLLEYTETLHWVGVVDKSNMDPAAFRAIVKKCLPAKFQTTEIIDHTTHRAMWEAVHILFGPSDPLLTTAIMNQDVFELKLRGAIFTHLVPVFQDEAPGMTADEAETAVRKLVPELEASEIMKKSSNPTPPDPTSPPKNDTGDLLPLTYTVSFPGKVVKTDGITDPMTGGVYWSLYAPVVEFGDVTLNLVVDPSK